MKNDIPTTRQLEVLATVTELSESLGRCPNATEVAEHMGLTRAGAAHMLKALEQKGLLADEPKTVSSGQWKATTEGRRWLKRTGAAARKEAS